MIDIRLVSVAEHSDSVSELIADNWHESGLADHKLNVSLRNDKYLELERSGVLFALAAFEGEKIVGYSVNFVSRLMHSAETTFASNDVIFVGKEHREGRLGLSLIRKTEEEAKRRGASLMVWGAKPDSRFASLLPRIGYAVGEVSFVRGM